MLIIQGLEAEVALIGACCFFAFCGILSKKDAFGGLASSSVVGLCFLFPIAAAIEETGAMKKLVMPLLGNPDNLIVAIPRPFIIVMLLSGFMNNTGIVALMIPLLVNWSRQLKCHPGKLLMNLTYSAQLGGSTTLIGSSCTLVAAQSVRKAYVMGMLDTFPLGVSVGLICCLACSLLTPTSLLQSSAKKEQDIEASNTEHVRRYLPTPGMYEAFFAVSADSLLEGMDMDQLEEQIVCTAGVISARPESVIESDEDRKVASGDVIMVVANAQGIAGIRRIEGLE